MSRNSAIEWTEATWNPVTGCTKISDGCLNCYAARMTRRLKAMGSAVIAGRESGPGARPIKPEWVTEIRDKSLKSEVPFFFKQWGGTNKKKAGRSLYGKIYSQKPQILNPRG